MQVTVVVPFAKVAPDAGEQVTVEVPEQLSVAVGAVTVAEHCPVTVVKVPTVGTGAVVSFTITVWFCVEVFPCPSL